MKFLHTNLRVAEIERSVAFYEALGFERRGRLQLDGVFNVYMGLPGEADLLELNVNETREDPIDPGGGFGHLALAVADLDAVLAELAKVGIEPEVPPFHPGGRTEFRICFVVDPDGYKTELVDGGDFITPQDPAPA